jgi:hypothetical protein
MPIVDSSSSSPLVVFDLPFLDLTAPGTVTPGSGVNFDLPFIEMTPNAGVQIQGAATFDLPFLDLTVEGRLNADANVFGSAAFDLPFIDLTADGQKLIDAVAVFDLPFIDLTADGTLATAEDFELNIILDILPPSPAGNYIEHWLPRLKVNGSEIPVKGGQYSEGEDSAGATLRVELARISDRSVMVAGASIEFGFGRKVGGAWDEASFQTLITDGTVEGTGHSISLSNGSPTDAFQVTSRSGTNNRFSITPETDLVIYDPLRETLNQVDFDILLDTQGNQYLTELKPIAGLTLHQLFDEVLVDRCGFSGVQTNLPDFPILRADCPIGRSYLASIRGYFGMFEPAIFAVGDEVWIIDTTIVLPSGFPAPRTVEIRHYRTLSASEQILDIDGFLVQYVEDKRSYDYITSRTETFTEENGESGDPDYTETFVEQLWREYRRTSNPGLVLHEELYFERRTTSASGVGTINETRENFNFDSNGRYSFREKTTHARIPDLDNPGEFTLALVNDEKETLHYASHPYQPKSQYVQRREQHVRGLIVIDSENQQLQNDFELDYLTAYRRGNLVEGMATRFGPIKSIIELAEPLRDGQVRVRPVTIDHLSRSVPEDDVQMRPGDVSLNGIAPRQSRVLVLESDDSERTTNRIEAIHAGELPPTHAIPWARRRLKAVKSKNRTIDAQTIGYDAGLRKGMPVTFTGRSETIGTFLIAGRSVPFGREGVFMNLSCKEI